MKDVYTFFETTIIENIDFTDYGIINDGYLYDKIKTLYNIFKREFIHGNNKHLNEVILFKDWLQGLPNVLSVPYTYSEILQNGILAGFDLSDDDKEDEFLETYWINLANAFFTLKNNL